MKRVAAVGLCLVSVLLCLTPGCSDDKPSGPILGDFAYPLQVGQIWKYSGIQYDFNFVPESLATNHSTSYSYVSTVQVMQKTKLLDTLDVYSFREIVVQSGASTYECWHYYNNRPDGLYNYAYGGTNTWMQPRKIAPTQYQFTFQGKPLDYIRRLVGTSLLSPSGLTSQSDSLTHIEDPPFHSLKYPLNAGSEWPVRIPPKLSPINKKAIDRVQIQVPAGIFTCARIQWLYDLNNDGNWDSDIEAYDYISQIGLVKRTRVYHNVTVTAHEYPLGIGTCDMAEVWELTQVQSGQ
jgi:hypothetical protein